MAYRKEKVESLIKEEISLIFLHKLNDQSLGFVTVTNVKVSPDMKLAKIYISIFDKAKRKAALERVNDAKGMIRAELAHKIKMRFTPDLNFYLDDTADYAEKIEELIKQIHKDDKKED